MPCIERPAYLTETPAWVAVLIEIPALAILVASFLVTIHFQDKKKLLKEAVFPFIFALAFLVKRNLFCLFERKKKRTNSIYLVNYY